jgi:hypothetical protein
MGLNSCFSPAALLKWIRELDFQNKVEQKSSLEITSSELKRMFSKADTNNDGYVDRVTQHCAQLPINWVPTTSEFTATLFTQILRKINAILCPAAVPIDWDPTTSEFTTTTPALQ